MDRHRNDVLIPQVRRVWHANFLMYGAKKVWRQLKLEGIEVARCSVERLMKRLGLEGVRRGKVVKTIVSDKALPCPLDRVNRQFRAECPSKLWGDSLWQGRLYVAFVIDVFARRIVSASACTRTSCSMRWNRHCMHVGRNSGD